MDAAIQPATRKSYKHHWLEFLRFINSNQHHSTVNNVQPIQLVLFITFLVNKGLGHATIRNYLSAISFYLKLKGFNDPTTTFVVQKIMIGVKNLSPPSIRRDPVSIVILDRLIGALPLANLTQYDQIMLKATMSLMYFGCLRIGEIVISNSMQHTLKDTQVKISVNPPKVPAINIKFTSYKHLKGSPPMLTLKSLDGKQHCPVHALQQYLNIRPRKSSQPLILNQDTTPLNRKQFKKYLDMLIKAAKLNQYNLNTHSFRIGRTTDMVMSGCYSDTYIQKIGRWSTAAYKQYVRPLIVCPQ